MFVDYEFVKTLIDKTSTDKGLHFVVRINLKHYITGIKTDKSEVDNNRIQRHPIIPKLNYRIAA